MDIIGISRKHNNGSKRRKIGSKCSSYWCMYYKDDDGKFKTKIISKAKAYSYKLMGIKQVKTKQFVTCSECNFQQEDLDQQFCSNCGK